MKLFKRNGEMFDEDGNPQLPLDDCEVQEEFDIAESNPELLDKLKALNEAQAWKEIVVE